MAIALKDEVDRTWPISLGDFDDANPTRVTVWRHPFEGRWYVNHLGRTLYIERRGFLRFAEAINYAQSYALGLYIVEHL